MTSKGTKPFRVHCRLFVIYATQLQAFKVKILFLFLKGLVFFHEQPISEIKENLMNFFQY